MKRIAKTLVLLSVLLFSMNVWAQDENEEYVAGPVVENTDEQQVVDEAQTEEEVVEEVTDDVSEYDAGPDVESTDEASDGDMTVETAEPTSTATHSSGSGTDIKDVLIGIALLLAILAMIGHMLYVLLWPSIFEMIYKQKHPSKVWKTTVEEERAHRLEAGLPEEMPEEEAVAYADAIEAAFDNWTPLPDDYNKKIISTKKQLDDTTVALRAALDAHVTKPDIVNRMNEIQWCIESASKRQFDGSKLLIVLTLILCGILWYSVGFSAMTFFLFSLVLYYLACLKPGFMFNKRTLKGDSGRGALNWLLGGVFGMIAGAQTVRTVTHWSDGSKTVDDDNTQHLVAWAIGLIVIVLLIVFLFAWALVNWLRNYVLYR